MLKVYTHKNPRLHNCSYSVGEMPNYNAYEFHQVVFECSFVFSQGSKRIVMVDSLSRFSEFIDPFVLDLPSGTLAFEEEGKVRYTHTLLTQHTPTQHPLHTQMEFTNIRFLMFKQVPLQIPATLHICGRGLVVSLVEKIKVFDIPTMLREIYHIKDIRDVSVFLPSPPLLCVAVFAIS